MCVKFNINEFKLAYNEGGKKRGVDKKTQQRSADNLGLLIYQSVRRANILAHVAAVEKLFDCFLVHVKYQLHGLVPGYDANLLVRQ